MYCLKDVKRLPDSAELKVPKMTRNINTAIDVCNIVCRKKVL